MKPDLTKRLLAAGLAVTLLFGASACGKKPKEETPEAQETVGMTDESKNYVYRAEPLAFSSDVQLDGMNCLQKVGDRIYAAGMTYDTVPSAKVYAFDKDGSNVKELTLPLKSNQDIGASCFDEEGSLYTIRSSYGWDVIEEEETASEEESLPEEEVTPEEAAPRAEEEEGEAPDADVASEEETNEAEEDELIAVEGSPLPGDMEMTLVKYDADGKEVFVAAVPREEEEESDGWWYVRDLKYDDGRVLLFTPKKVHVYSAADGALEGSIPVPETLPVDILVRSEDGRLFMGGADWDDKTGQVVPEYRELLPEEEKFGEPIEWSIENPWRFQYYTGEGYDFFLRDDAGIYGMNLGEEPVKLMDYLASDILNEGSDLMVSFGADTFISLGWDSETGKRNAVSFTKVDPATIKDKTILTMASYYLNWRTKNAVVQFNRSNDTYRITVEDYSKYDTDTDYNAGMTRFNADLAAGNIPDILELNSGIPVDSYMAKGLFEDLTPYLDADPDLHREDYLENILGAFNPEGKLYQIVSSFSVSTLVGKTSVFGREPGITAADIEAAREAAGVEYKYLMGITSRESALYMLMMYGNHSFVDWETGNCRFDSQDFIDLIEFIRRFPKELPDSVWEEDTQGFYRSGRSLLESAYFSAYMDYRNSKDATFGEDITLVGYPNGGVKDYSGSLINSSRRLAITSTSENKEGAWSFVRGCLTEEYQSKVAEQEGCFPVSKKALAALEKAAQEKPYYMDEDGNKVEYDNTWWINGQEVVVEPMSAEEARFFTEYLGSLSETSSYDENIFNIIQEEIEPALEGQKPAAEAARIIQSRVSVYLKENT